MKLGQKVPTRTKNSKEPTKKILIQHILDYLITGQLFLGSPLIKSLKDYNQFRILILFNL